MTIQTPLVKTTILLICLLHSAGILASEEYRKRLHHQVNEIATENDVRTEIAFGRDIAARILGRYPLLQNEPIQKYVRLVGKALALHSSRPEIIFHFAVLDSPHANAYSTPGGYIFITKGALEKMRDESELAAVLGHEVGHITRKHIVEEFNIKGSDQSGISSISRMVGGSQDTARVAFSQAVDRAMKILFETGFKQEDEYESDQEAIMLLAATEYDPSALQRYLKRFNRDDRNSKQKISTHPPSAERIGALSKFLRDEGLSKVEYSRARKRFRKNVKNNL